MTDSQYILLVEDNPDDEELTLLAFSRNNIANRIEVVRDGAEALDFLFGTGQHASRDLDDIPAVVLLDLNLPKVSGLEVLEQIRKKKATRRLPVVVLTSSRHQEDIIQSYDLGANSFIRKPVDFEKFVDAMRQLQLYWLVLNESPGRSRNE